MPRLLSLLCAINLAVGELAPLLATAQPTARTTLYVEETIGIRRFFYPVDARVPFAQGSLYDASTVRLLRGGAELPAMFTPIERWDDGSVQWLAVNFNVSIGPLESVTFQVEYGPSVRSVAEARRGLTLSDEGDALQVGQIRLGKNGDPLLQSVGFNGENIGVGINGLRVYNHDQDAFGIDTTSVAVEVLREGAQYVEVHYAGRFVIGPGGELPFEMTIGMPNSKSWFKASIFVEDPDDRIGGVSFDTPLSVGSELPFVWDFGTERWTYGSLRNQDDAVRLSMVVEANDERAWLVETRRDGAWQSYEESGEQSQVMGWGHVQAERVVAFAMQAPHREGEYQRITVDGRGQLSMMVPASDVRRHELTAYHHYVGVPVQIGAATSPMSMLNPLVTRCDEARYIASGVEPPNAR